MTISPVAAAPGGFAGAASASTATLTSDFQTFLRMLTAQLQHQDPLNPMEATDFAVQLATFSGVEQQVRSNDLLRGLSEQMALMGVSQLAGWVGMEARTPAKVVWDGAEVELWGQPPAGADRTELVIRDEAGKEVARLDVDPGDEPITWSGEGPDDTTLPAGTYVFELHSYSGEASLGSQMLEAYTAITEVRVEGGVAILVLKGGLRAGIADITGLRAPA